MVCPRSQRLWAIGLSVLDAMSWVAVGLGTGLAAGGWVLDISRVAAGGSYTLWSFVLTAVYAAYLILPGTLLGIAARWLRRRLDSELVASWRLRWMLGATSAVLGLALQLWMNFPT